MAIVTRYFSTTGAGAADGTTWADRAALFSAGNWSSVITGFNFSGTDSLLCLIEGALTYTCGQELTSGLFTNAPSVSNPLILHACNSSGALLSPPDPDWVCSQPPFSTSTLPVLDTTANIGTINIANCVLRLLAFTASNRTSGSVVSQANIDWVRITNSTSNTGAVGINNTLGIVRNTVVLMTGTSFNFGVYHNGTAASNIRVDGTTATSSGTRVGISSQSTAAQTIWDRVCVIGCVGGGFLGATGNASRMSQISKLLTVNCGTYGFRGNATASQTVYHQLIDSIFVNGSGFGVDGQSTARIIVSNCRLRDNTSGNFSGMGNYPVDWDVITSAGTDGDEFVNAASGDYRIKNTSSLWGKGLGPGDEPAAGGSGGSALHLGHLGQTGIGVF